MSLLGTTQPFILFIPSLVLIALLGGFGPALFATLLSAAIADYLFLEPINSLAVNNTRDIVGLALFGVMGVTISWVGDWFRRRAMRLQEFEKALRSLLMSGLRAIWFALRSRLMPEAAFLEKPFTEVRCSARSARYLKTVRNRKREQRIAFGTSVMRIAS